MVWCECFVRDRFGMWCSHALGCVALSGVEPWGGASAGFPALSCCVRRKLSRYKRGWFAVQLGLVLGLHPCLGFVFVCFPLVWVSRGFSCGGIYLELDVSHAPQRRPPRSLAWLSRLLAANVTIECEMRNAHWDALYGHGTLGVVGSGA